MAYHTVEQVAARKKWEITKSFCYFPSGDIAMLPPKNALSPCSKEPNWDGLRQT